MSRRALKGLLLALLVLLAGLVLVNLLLEPPRPGTRPARVRLGALVGQVEVRRDGGKQWRPARLGQQLQAGDEIRTGMFSEATLLVSNTSSVVVSPNSSFVVGSDFVRHSSFELARGQISAAIPATNQRQYQFHSSGSDTVATSRRGEFDMATDGRGTVVVDSHRGQVEVRSQGRKVILRKGLRSTVRPGKPPAPAMPIPNSLALRVKWPPSKLDRTRATVSGRASAGALVMVNGLAVYADANGSFTVEVPLRQGSNRLVVNARDPSGRTVRRESGTIQVDTRPPRVHVNAKDLWK